MGLSNVLQAIQTDLLNHLPSAPLNTVVFRTGARQLATNDGGPRIVWVRQASTYKHAVQGTKSPFTPRILRSRESVVAAHVWAMPNPDNGNDDSDTELLADQLVAAAYRCTHGESFEVLSDEWPQPEWDTAGYLCVVLFRFSVPVLDLPSNTAGTTQKPPPQDFSWDESTEPPPSGQLQAPGDS